MRKLIGYVSIGVIVAFLVVWAIVAINANCILDVPQNCLVFKMGPLDGHLIKMDAGKHLVWNKLDYRVEPLASTGKKNFTVEETEFLSQIAQSGWTNYNNFRRTMSQ